MHIVHQIGYFVVKLPFPGLLQQCLGYLVNMVYHIGYFRVQLPFNDLLQQCLGESNIVFSLVFSKMPDLNTYEGRQHCFEG